MMINNQFNQNMNYNNNLYEPIFNNISQIDDNMNNLNYINNEEFPIQILNKNNSSLSVKAFPHEKNHINIIFKNDFGNKVIIIIPPYKKISELCKIYAQTTGIEINKQLLIFNGNTIDINDQRQLTQVFNNYTTISVY